jgi:membrane-bound lytic murein transglycosylase A
MPRWFPFLLTLFLLTGCEAEKEEDVKQPPSEPEILEPVKEVILLNPATYGDLPGWTEDDMVGFRQAFDRSCRRLLKADPHSSVGSPAIVMSASDWHPVCQALRAMPETGSAEDLRTVLEAHFYPFLVRDAGKDAGKGEEEAAAQGLFTGYFEAELKGSRTKTEIFSTPLYKRPDDLITVNLSRFDPELKGHSIVGAVKNGQLLPYPKRGDIEAGLLKGQELELVWIDDPVDVFLLQVQGSGRVILQDGNVMRVGFAAHNGHSYRSIGRKLIEEGELQPHAASWSGIRGWIEDHPDRAAELFSYNPRFIFFRTLETEGPIGAEGVVLTAKRSLAVDTRYIPLGAPVWLDTVSPGQSGEPLQRLMVAQDKGGAIKGVVRGDFFWGYGEAALREAGRMKSRGRYFLLLPKPVAERILTAS